MAERMTPKPVPPHGGTQIVIRVPPGGGLDDTPDTGPPFEDPPPTSPRPRNVNRLASSAAERELTVHPAEGPVPQQFGGPLRVGGYPIYYRKVGLYHLLDLAIGEGPYEKIEKILFGTFITMNDIGIGALGEVHLGTPGDTTSDIISVYEGSYTTPDNLARVTLRFKDPTQKTGPWNPFDFTCEATRGNYYDAPTGFSSDTANPIAAAHMALSSRVDTVYELVEADWSAAWAACEYDIGGGVKRWQFALRVDTQDTLENWVKVFFAYCMAYPRYQNGQYGVYLELARDFALNGDGQIFHFADYTDTTVDVVQQPQNTSGEITYTRKGSEEIPTIVTVDYTNVQTVGGILTFQAASVQVPQESDLDPSIDRIELRLTLRGIMSPERAQRMATLAYNVAQLDKDILIPSWQGAMQMLPGDRARVASLNLLAADAEIPNAGFVPGWDDIVFADVKLGDSPVLRAREYRDATYGEPIDTNPPPEPPPPPPDVEEPPDCPTELEAPHANVSEYGMIEFLPGESVLISYYAVYDIFFGSETLVGTVDQSAPLGPDGKHHATFLALVHTDLDGDVHLNVRVKSVTYAGLYCDPGPEANWDVEFGGPAEECCYQPSASTNIFAPTVFNTTYSIFNYSRIDQMEFLSRTSFYDTEFGDFFCGTLGNASGILVPKFDGGLYVSATVGWAAHADSDYRALGLFYLNNGGAPAAFYGQAGLHQLYITIDSGGTGYTTGDELVFNYVDDLIGDYMEDGGLPIAARVSVTSGVITGIIYYLGYSGVGYFDVPTITVAGSGSGAVLTAHLPEPITGDTMALNCDGSGVALYGALYAEDIVPAVNSSTVPTRQHLGQIMGFKKGGGLLIGVQQGCGTSLGLLDTGTSALVSEGCRLSIFRVASFGGIEGFGICPPPG